VVAGFAVLGTEYAWAAAALDRSKATAGGMATGASTTSDAVRDLLRRPSGFGRPAV
jgi:hypothetical protein